MRSEMKVGDVIISRSCSSSGQRGTVNWVRSESIHFFAYMEDGSNEWFSLSEQGDDWDFAEDQRQPDPYTGPARPPTYSGIIHMPPEPPQSVYIESKSHDLVLTIPKGTKRLEGEFEGYKVILEKL